MRGRDAREEEIEKVKRRGVLLIGKMQEKSLIERFKAFDFYKKLPPNISQSTGSGVCSKESVEMYSVLDRVGLHNVAYDY